VHSNAYRLDINPYHMRTYNLCKPAVVDYMKFGNLSEMWSSRKNCRMACALCKDVLFKIS